jgi:hypothetical protein
MAGATTTETGDAMDLPGGRQISLGHSMLIMSLVCFVFAVLGRIGRNFGTGKLYFWVGIILILPWVFRPFARAIGERALALFDSVLILVYLFLGFVVLSG